MIWRTPKWGEVLIGFSLMKGWNSVVSLFIPYFVHIDKTITFHKSHLRRRPVQECACGYVHFFWWSHKQIFNDHRLPGCPLSATNQSPYVLQNHRFCVHRALQRPPFYICRLESSIQSPFQSWTLPILDRNKTITSLNSHLTSPHSHIL